MNENKISPTNKMLEAIEIQSKTINSITKSFETFEKYTNTINKFQQSISLYQEISVPTVPSSLYKAMELAAKVIPSHEILRTAELANKFACQNSQLFEYINIINQSLSKLIPQTPIWLQQEAIARLGWILPINKVEFVDFNYLSSDIDTEIITICENNDGCLIKNIQQEILNDLRYVTHKKQFEESVVCYNMGLYFACVASLIPVIEGVIENKINPTSTRIIQSFNIMTEDLQEGLIKDPKVRLFMLLKEYLICCYANDISFNEDEPDIVNRHWADHGKYKNKVMKKNDCLQLFFALYAMNKVVDFCRQLENAA